MSLVVAAISELRCSPANTCLSSCKKQFSSVASSRHGIQIFLTRSYSLSRNYYMLNPAFASFGSWKFLLPNRGSPGAGLSLEVSFLQHWLDACFAPSPTWQHCEGGKGGSWFSHKAKPSSFRGQNEEPHKVTTRPIAKCLGREVAELGVHSAILLEKEKLGNSHSCKSLRVIKHLQKGGGRLTPRGLNGN